MRRPVVLTVLILLVYLALSLGTAHALRPWVDEGWHGAPAWSLAFRGYMGTPSFIDHDLKDINRYTYWIMPVYPVIQAAWYRLFNFSLESMRALSVLCGLLGLLAWTAVFHRLTGDSRAALLFMALMACDYIFLTGAATGRAEAMALAFQAGAFAAYLRWRESNLWLAIVLSQTLVVASGLTHPNGGMLAFLGALWITLYFDRKRLRPTHIALAAIPYVIGATGWGAYIAQDPQAFVSQYGAQIAMRSHVVYSPWRALHDEIVNRILLNMGLGGHSPGSSGPHYLKAFIFAAYAFSIACLAAIHSLRAKTPARVLLGLIAIYFMFYTFLEGTKASYYLVYFVFPLTAAVALCARWFWQADPGTRAMVALGLAGLFVIQGGGVLYRIRRDAYHKEYLPAAAYIRAHAQPGDLIVASHELGFIIGFRDGFVDDHLLGLETGRRPNWILVEEIYQGRFDTLAFQHPKQFAELQKRLADYQVVYDANHYRVLELRPAS